MLNKARFHPIAVTYLFIVVIILLNRIPVERFFTTLNFSTKSSASLENITIDCIVIGICFWLILKFQFIHFLKLDKFETKHLIYYLPLLFYFILFANSSVFFKISKEVLYSMEMFITFLEKLISAFLEEIVFRGFVLVLILNKYIERKNGVLISVLIASFIFGTTHFINLITQSYLLTVGGVIKQVYIATCLGVMFSAMFLKSRNIFILIVAHFIFNIFSVLEELEMNATIEASVIDDRTSFEIVTSNLLILIIFGIPLLIGIAILKNLDIKLLKNQLKLSQVAD